MVLSIEIRDRKSYKCIGNSLWIVHGNDSRNSIVANGHEINTGNKTKTISTAAVWQPQNCWFRLAFNNNASRRKVYLLEKIGNLNVWRREMLVCFPLHSFPHSHLVVDDKRKMTWVHREDFLDGILLLDVEPCPTLHDDAFAFFSPRIALLVWSVDQRVRLFVFFNVLSHPVTQEKTRQISRHSTPTYVILIGKHFQHIFIEFDFDFVQKDATRIVWI